jgi:acylpyruvate hydrolase
MFVAQVSHKGRSGVAISEDGISFRCDLSLVPASDDAVLKAIETRTVGTAAVSLRADELRFLPPLTTPSKIICVGLNYAEHSRETGNQVPSYPTIFARFASSLIGHEQPMIRPAVSEQLDFEGELVAVIGQGGRNISKAAALDHVLGYSLFNDGSIRDYQRMTPQWTVGKNFDGTGSFGPWIVTTDQLPPGCAGLNLQTRLNGKVVQSASTDDLIFDVATLISTLSEAFTLSRGDVIVTGTPSGVGAARKPPLWMKPGDVCEVEVGRVGVLRNTILDEAVDARA